MEKPIIRRPWERERLPTQVPGESQCDTSFGNDTDVNHIMARFTRSGQLPPGNNGEPIYEDVTALQGDLTELIQQTKETTEKIQEATQRIQRENEEKEKTEIDNLRKRVAELEASTNEEPSESVPPGG